MGRNCKLEERSVGLFVLVYILICISVVGSLSYVVFPSLLYRDLVTAKLISRQRRNEKTSNCFELLDQLCRKRETKREPEAKQHKPYVPPYLLLRLNACLIPIRVIQLGSWEVAWVLAFY
jgi:hypothetical protein